LCLFLLFALFIYAEIYHQQLLAPTFTPRSYIR
jgi:hypothetical protein